MTSETMVRDKTAFVVEEGGYRLEAVYLIEPEGKALVEITKGGAAVQSWLHPAYAIWNVAAHAADYVAALEAETTP